MADIVMTNESKAPAKLDGSLLQRVFAFLAKLQADDTPPACTSSR